MQKITSEFAGKTVFSTLELKMAIGGSSYVDKNCLMLCTFNMPFGRCRFIRMPFGIKSSSEVLEEKIKKPFAGIHNSWNS